ncbi:MAG: protein-L-isoaspartate(D-aspartate) O-methyltransferase [Chitinivibrionia bacterium]|jgi:protein-L-isoaspartate(D-aspartate) O-methyltransferase|nr:protein-L-isoaspartate(D-aspartate) O-methyltransferase [Chitinivibrionia bacterium]
MLKLAPEFAMKKLLAQIIQNGFNDPEVIKAMASTPRHLFVDDALMMKAYDDVTLPIGNNGQTISQPSVVAKMTQLLDLKEGQKVLEIGTGSGYQAAILARFTRRLFTVERLSPLLELAKKRHKNLELLDISYRLGDGSNGWPGQGTFDRIIVTAGAPSVPPAYFEQLAVGGKLLIPVGTREEQRLTLYTKKEDETVSFNKYDTVVFVPLVGHFGFNS